MYVFFLLASVSRPFLFLFSPVLPVQDARSDWGPLIVFHLRRHLIRIRKAVWNKIKFTHPLNTLAQLKCFFFFMNQQYHVAKRTKGLLDFVLLSCLYSPLNPQPFISQSPISAALKMYVPHLFCFLKKGGHCPTYLPFGTWALLGNALVFPEESLHPTFNPALLLGHIFQRALLETRRTSWEN